jgi:hypothetical protein
MTAYRKTIAYGRAGAWQDALHKESYKKGDAGDSAAKRATQVAKQVRRSK